MPHLPQFSTEQIIFIIFVLLIIFIGLPIFFICGCCKYKIQNNRNKISNSKIITEYS